MNNPLFDNGLARLYHADARSLPIDDGSVDCVVTSPPYFGLRDYGLEEQGIGLEATPEEFCANMVKVFREVWRVLKPTGTVWLNLGDSYNGSGGEHKNDAGQSGLTNNRKAVGFVPGRNLSSLKAKDLMGMPWRVAFALQADGWYLRSDIIWSKPNPMPESVADRPTKAHEYIFLLTKSPKYYYDSDAIRERLAPASISRLQQDVANQVGTTRAHGGAKHNGNLKAAGNIEQGRNKRTVWEIATQPYSEAHFATFPEDLVEPCILAGSSEKGVCAQCGKPWERIVEASGGTIGEGSWHDHTNDMVRGMRDESHGKSKDGTYKREHIGWDPTCTCTADVVPATVLDPFAGSGTTLAVAQKFGRRSVGTDLNREYLDLATKRLLAIPLPLPNFTEGVKG